MMENFIEEVFYEKSCGQFVDDDAITERAKEIRKNLLRKSEDEDTDSSSSSIYKRNYREYIFTEEDASLFLSSEENSFIEEEMIDAMIDDKKSKSNKNSSNNQSSSKTNQSHNNTKSDSYNKKSSIFDSKSKSIKTLKDDTNIALMKNSQSSSSSSLIFKDYLFLQVESFLHKLPKIPNYPNFDKYFRKDLIYNMFLKLLKLMNHPKLQLEINFLQGIEKISQTYLHNNKNTFINDILNEQKVFEQNLLDFLKLNNFSITKFEEIKKKVKAFSVTTIESKISEEQNNFYFLKYIKENFQELYGKTNLFLTNCKLLENDLKSLTDYDSYNTQFLTNLNVVTSELLIEYKLQLESKVIERKVSTMIYLNKKNSLTTEDALGDIDIYSLYTDNYKYFEMMNHPINSHSEKALFFNLVDNFDDVAQEIGQKICGDVNYFNRQSFVKRLDISRIVLYVYTMREPCEDCKDILSDSWNNLSFRIFVSITKYISYNADTKIPVTKEYDARSIKKIIYHTYPKPNVTYDIKKNPESFQDSNYNQFQPPLYRKEKEFIKRRYNIKLENKRNFLNNHNQSYIPENFTFFLSKPSLKTVEDDFEKALKIEGEPFNNLFNKYFTAEEQSSYENNPNNRKQVFLTRLLELIKSVKESEEFYNNFQDVAHSINVQNQSLRRLSSKIIIRFFKQVKQTQSSDKKIDTRNFKHFQDKFNNCWFSFGKHSDISLIVSKYLKLDKNYLTRMFLSSRINISKSTTKKLSKIINSTNTIFQFIQKNDNLFMEFIRIKFGVNIYLVDAEKHDKIANINENSLCLKLILRNQKVEGEEFSSYSYMYRKDICNDNIIAIRHEKKTEDDRIIRGPDECILLRDNFNTSYLNSALQMLLNMEIIGSTILGLKSSEEILIKGDVLLIRELHKLFSTQMNSNPNYDAINFLNYTHKVM